MQLTHWSRGRESTPSWKWRLEDGHAVLRLEGVDSEVMAPETRYDLQTLRRIAQDMRRHPERYTDEGKRVYRKGLRLLEKSL